MNITIKLSFNPLRSRKSTMNILEIHIILIYAKPDFQVTAVYIREGVDRFNETRRDIRTSYQYLKKKIVLR